MFMSIKTSKVLLITIFLGSFISGYSQRLYPFSNGGKCGFLNQSGAVTIPPQFDFCTHFKEHLAGISTGGKVGYINKRGQVVIPLKYDGLLPEQFSEGFAPVQFRTAEGTRRVGYVDRFAKFNEIEGATEAFSFSEGLARVRRDEKWGYIDKSFMFVIPPQFKFARSFYDGLASVGTLDEEFYIDKLGRKVITNYGSNGGDFSEGLAWFRSKYTGYGFMNTLGRIVVEPQFSYPCFFKANLACVEYEGKWGYIDRSGKFVIPPQFDEAEDFSEDGFAVVKLAGKFGLIDNAGRIIIPARYDRLEWLKGLALIEKAGVREYIDVKGNTVWTHE